MGMKILEITFDEKKGIEVKSDFERVEVKQVFDALFALLLKAAKFIYSNGDKFARGVYITVYLLFAALTAVRNETPEGDKVLLDAVNKYKGELERENWYDRYKK